MQRGTVCRGDYRHLLRNHRQDPFPGGIEQSLGEKALLQFLKFLEQIPCSVRSKAHGIQLVGSVFRIDIHISGDQYPVSVPRFHPGTEGVLPEHDAADSRFLVLQGEVPVAGGKIMPETADFSPHSYAADPRFPPDGFGNQQIQF